MRVISLETDPVFVHEREELDGDGIVEYAGEDVPREVVTRGLRQRVETDHWSPSAPQTIEAAQQVRYPSRLPFREGDPQVGKANKGTADEPVGE
jgi:hypothetical protein